MWLLGGVEADNRGAAHSPNCAFDGRHWQQEEASQNNEFEPPQLYAVVQLLHRTYQKGLGKSLPNKLAYSSTLLPLNK